MFIGKLGVDFLLIIIAMLRSYALIMVFLFASASQLVAQQNPDVTVKIYTDTYRPYVLPEGEVDGSAMRLVRLVVRNMGLQPDFEHIDYGYGFYATRKSKGDLSFPWLKTEERQKDVLYSIPLYDTEIQFFYNIRFFPESIEKSALEEKIIGRVINYSYGEDIDTLLNEAENQDRAKTFSTDVDAIAALLNGDIDVLPQLNSVLRATLDTSFADQSRLIRSVQDMTTLFPNYLIAPKTAEGQRLIKAFNKSYLELLKAGVIDTNNLSFPVSNSLPSDIAEIVASEGFPVVIGTSRSDAAESYAIPPGTRVLILDWSDRILAPSDSDQLYKTMVDETLVLILNGPHIGKELYIKNMHLIIAK